MAAPSITFSSLEDGESIEVPLSLGEGGYQLDDPDEQEIWIRHDSVQAITNVKLYIGTYTDVYEGTDDPQTDFDNIIKGGDNYPSGGDQNASYFGWLEISTDDGSNWTVVSSDPDTGGSLSEPIVLGTIEPAESVKVILRHRFYDTFSDELSIGKRQFDLRLTYTHTG